MENADPTVPEPYRETVVGQIVALTDDGILLDDSICCEDPQEGVIFKILLNDLRISRYVDRNLVKVGDTVQITYAGSINAEDGYVIDSAISAAHAILADAGGMIPE